MCRAATAERGRRTGGGCVATGCRRLAEVVGHLPRIYGQYRKLISYARSHKPVGALLTDSPDFHLRLARHLKRLHVPVYYLVAPQVWAWRQHRVKAIARLVDKLFCLFPFEEQWFRDRGVDATYIGHPLASMVRPRKSRAEFFAEHSLPPDRRLITLLPGSRAGEACRHMPALLEAVGLLRAKTIPVCCPRYAERFPDTRRASNFSGTYRKLIHPSSRKRHLGLYCACGLSPRGQRNGHH